MKKKLITIGMLILIPLIIFAGTITINVTSFGGYSSVLASGKFTGGATGTTSTQYGTIYDNVPYKTFTWIGGHSSAWGKIEVDNRIDYEDTTCGTSAVFYLSVPTGPQPEPIPDPIPDDD